MKTVTFNVKDMHCVNCAMKLQDLEDDLAGVKTVDASYRTQKMVVQFDETLVNEEQIIQAVKLLGYTAELDG
jgi:copper chaperone CopZ